MRDILNRFRNKEDSPIISFFVGSEVGPEEERRIRFFVLISLLAIAILLTFVVLNLREVSRVRSVLNAVATLSLILSLGALKYLKSTRIAFRINVLVLGIYFVFLMIIGGIHGSRIFWMLIYPVYAFLMLGKREGLAWTLVGLLVSLYVLTDPNEFLSTYPYKSAIRSRFLFTYGIIAIVAYVFESVREKCQQVMEEERLALESEVAERTRAEEALREEYAFRSSVIERTAEGLCVCHEIEDHPFIRFTVWNDRMKDLTGYDLDDINRSGWYQTVYPDPEVQEKARMRMARMREGEDLRGEEWTITRAPTGKSA